MPDRSPTFMSPGEFLAHWQAHRRLTRRVIEAMPEDKLFTFSVGGMRPFGELVQEMLGIGVPMLREVVGGVPAPFADDTATSKAELLRNWDAATEAMNSLWPQIAQPFDETVTLFQQFTFKLYEQFLYALDNEIHHRGQGYVYLRALGIEPPPFYQRD